MTRKLIIHIGSHKTGTSSIQHALFKNKAALQKQGFTLFNQDPDGSERKSGNALTWVKFKLAREYRIEGRIRKGLSDALSTAGDNVIISAESFSWVFSEGNIRSFHRKLSPYFDDIKIVAYVRRQDMQAISQYQQASKHNAFVAARFYNGGTRALPPYQEYFQKYLNYHQRLGMWADAFGERNMIVRIFEKNHLKNGDAVDDFFDATDIKKESASIRQNESSGFEKTKVGHLISEQEFPLPTWIALTRYLDNTGKLLPARDDAAAFYAMFKTGNTLLNERFSLNVDQSLFMEDFNMYSIEGNDQWSETTANAAIRNLLKGVRNLPAFGRKDMEFMHECAKNLEKFDAVNGRKLADVLTRYSLHYKVSIDMKSKLISRIKAYLRQ